MTENRQPHVFALHHQWPYRFIENMPLQWKFNICTCDQFGYSTSPFSPCTKCRKYNAILFFKCGACDGFFLRDFKSPWFCEFHPLCWGDIENYDTCCCGRLPKTSPPPSAVLVASPVGLRLKFYSAEELAAPIEDFVL